MSLNFPASDQSPWTAPNGVVYTWNENGTEQGYWETQVQGGGGGSQDLQSVTDQGNTTTNSLIAGNNADSGGSAGQDGCTLNSGGVVQAMRQTDTSNVWASYTAGDADAKITMTAGGNASFAGNIQLRADPSNGTNEGTIVRNNGNIVCTSNQASTPIIQGFQTGQAEGFSITAAGDASFAGTILARTDVRFQGTNFQAAIGTDGNDLTFSTINNSNNALIECFRCDSGQSNTGGSFLMGGDTVNNANVVLNNDGSAEFAAQLQCGDGPPGVPSFTVVSDRPAGSTWAIQSLVDGNDLTFAVDSNGDISSTNTAITQIGSERRIKKDIELIDPTTAWDTIKSVPYYTYNFIRTGVKSYGPIVDELPSDLVVEGTTSDEKGNIRTYNNGLLQARLFVALQEALKRIETLEAEVQALKEVK